MQKFFLIFFVSVLGICFSRWTQETPNVNDVILENVEALASFENKLPMLCEGIGTVICPINGNEVAFVYQGYSLR